MYEVWWNWREIEKRHTSINHKSRAKVRTIMSAIVFTLGILEMKIGYTTWDQWLVFPFWAPIFFWAVFDPALNLMRGKPLLHLGDAKLDRLQSGAPIVWFYFKLFFAALLLFVYCYGPLNIINA